MFVTDLYGPSGVEFEDTHIQTPTWQDIEQAIRQLDGYKLNGLSLRRDESDRDELDEQEHKHMVVAGGEDHLFFVMVSISSLNKPSRHFYLIDPSYGDKEELWSFLVSQSDTECLRHQMNDLESTLKAAKTFTESGALEPSLTWQ